MPNNVQLSMLDTTGGMRFYPPSTKFYAACGNNVFVAVNAHDVQAEQMVLWRKQYVDASFDVIVSQLERTPRYEQAKNYLFLGKPSSEGVTVFRAELLNGLASRGVIDFNHQDLEGRILRESEDFEPAQYSTMSGFIHEGLKKVKTKGESPERAKDTIEDWLRGKTVGPSDPIVFSALYKITGNKTFREWHKGAGESFSTSTGFWREYKLYTILRRQVTSYLQRSKDELRQKAKTAVDGKRHYGLDMTPELQFIINQFLEEVSDDLALVRVIKAETATYARSDYEGAKARLSPNLKNGAYTGELPSGMQLIGLRQLLTEGGFLLSVLHNVFSEMFIGEKKKRAIDKQGYRETQDWRFSNYYQFNTFVTTRINQVAQSLGVSGAVNIPKDYTDSVFGTHAGNAEEVMQEDFNIFTDFLAENVLSGKLDRRLGLPAFTVLQLFDVTVKYFSATPTIMREYSDVRSILLNPFLEKKEKRGLELKRNDLERKLRSRYSYGPDNPDKILFSRLIRGRKFGEAVQQAAKEATQNSRRKMRSEEFLSCLEDVIAKQSPELIMLEDPGYLRNCPEWAAAYEEEKGIVLTSRESLEILERHNLEALYRYIPEANFTFEKPDERAQLPKRRVLFAKLGAVLRVR